MVIRPRRRGDDAVARVGQQEGPGPVGALGLPGRQAALADERGLLVARHARDREAVGEIRQAMRPAELAGAREDFGQYSGRDREEVAEVIGPGERAEVHQQGPRGVRRVGDVSLARRSGARSAGCRPSRRPAPPPRPVGGPPEHDRAARRSWWPRSRGRAPARSGRRSSRGGRGALAERGRAAVLPDQGGADRLAGRAVPDDRRLALIGQADRRDPVRADVRLGQRGDDHRARPSRPGASGRARPSPGSGRSAGPRPGPGRPAGAGGRRRRPGCWWCPGRSRAGGRVPWSGLRSLGFVLQNDVCLAGTSAASYHRDGCAART